MKVWGVNLDGKNRCIVAANSRKEAAQLFRCSDNHLKNYGCVTGNPQEIEIATANPKVVYVKSYTSREPYKVRE